MEVLEAAGGEGLKLAEVAEKAGLSVRAVSSYLRVLRGKGKAERVRGNGHEVFYRRRRRP